MLEIQASRETTSLDNSACTNRGHRNINAYTELNRNIVLGIFL